MKFLTIITINKNNLQGLIKTVESVFSQTIINEIEFIVIDGDSIDGSKSYIETISSRLDYCVSEKDNGIFNAMNKGIKRASGKYLQFLNSGDYLYCDRSLEIIMNKNPKEDIIYTNYTDAFSGYLYRMPAELTFRFFYLGSLNHQASLIKHSLFNQVGLYNEDSPIIADWEFFIKSIILYGASTYYIDEPLICFDFSDSLSNKVENKHKIIQRRSEFLHDFFPLLVRDMKYIDSIEQSKTYKLIRYFTKIKSYFLR